MFLGMVGPWQVMLILIFGIFGILLPIIALIDILRNEFTGSNKLIWVLVVLFFNIFGALLYFIFGRSQKIPRA
ncbi:MAG: hypothetical protein CL868_10960 [Cytophagaceae bacterium]|nr:hypothetical protein [Cytophagaceae bacterium]|tara:strand:+ start:2094 stop:2312 length:219 start_codon:yes stop_codon:yes gene_type:complete